MWGTLFVRTFICFNHLSFKLYQHSTVIVYVHCMSSHCREDKNKKVLVWGRHPRNSGVCLVAYLRRNFVFSVRACFGTFAKGSLQRSQYLQVYEMFLLVEVIKTAEGNFFSGSNNPVWNRSKHEPSVNSVFLLIPEVKLFTGKNS